MSQPTAPSTLPDAATARPGNDAGNSKRDLWICFWILPVFYCVYGVMFVPLARLMPPPAPGNSVEQIAAFFDAHGPGIRIGFGMAMIVTGFVGVTNGLIVFEIKRMSVHPVLAYAYLASLAVGAVPGSLFASITFLTAVFRPDRDPQLVGLLYDVALLSFVGSLGCFTTSYLVFAVAVLLDTNNVFPNWMAYVAVWQIVTEVMAAPVFVFRSGPFAWNGAISFWMGVLIFVVWQAWLIVLVGLAIRRQPPGEQLAD